jgi:predicted metal-dependent peptidase
MPILMPPCDPHDKVIRAMVKIQKDHPFFSYILMNFKVSAKSTPGIKTAGVSKGGDFYYSDEYVKKLDGKQLVGLLVHETMHIAKGDFFRIGGRDKEIWNIASDTVIDYMLIKEGFTLPPDGYTPDANGYITIAGVRYNVAEKNTEQVYDELIKNATKIHMTMSGGGKGGDSGDKNNKNQDDSGDGDGNENDGKGCSCFDPKKNPGHGGFDTHVECGESAQTNAAAESKWKKVVIEAAISARSRGTMPGCMESAVDKLLNPTIDWRSRVMKFITNEIPVDYTNRLPNRTFYATGVWAPRVLRENLQVFVSVDYSGSTMLDREYFISEVSAILSAYEQIKGRLMFWDAALHEENDFEITRENRKDLTSLKVKDCNGGTRFGCYAEYLEKRDYKCRLHIVLTDGEIETGFKVPEGNIIFVLTKNGRDDIVKNYGAVCRISDTDE